MYRYTLFVSACTVHVLHACNLYSRFYLEKYAEHIQCGKQSQGCARALISVDQR